MKSLVALHAQSNFHKSYMEKQLRLHGENIDHSNTVGDYYVYCYGVWTRTNDPVSRRILKPSEVKEFLERHGNDKPVPESVWEEVYKEIDQDTYGYEKAESIGEFLDNAIKRRS